MPDDDIETMNKWGVAIRGDGRVVMLAPPRDLSCEDALLLAAWLVAIVGAEYEEFRRVLGAVENS